MAITDIVIAGSICSEMSRSSGTLQDVNPGDLGIASCVEMTRGNIGILSDIESLMQPWSVELLNFNAIFPNPSDVRTGVQFGNNSGSTGTLIVGGAASNEATLTKDTTHARGGTGTCALFTPTSLDNWGYWHFYVPATVGLPFVLSFWHRISTNWNGSLAVTIYDTDQTTKLLTSEAVTLTNDGAYHQQLCTQCIPTSAGTSTTVGMCLVRIEIKDGTTTGYVYIDDVGAA